MKRILFFIAIVSLFFACNNGEQTSNDKSINSKNSIEFIEMDYSSLDTFNLFFKIKDTEGHALKGLQIAKDSVRVYEDGMLIKQEFFAIQNLSHGVFSKNTTVSLLIDRSKDIPKQDMDKIRESVRDIVTSLPDSCVYISFFGNTISPTEIITEDNFEDFTHQFSPTDQNKSLYNALYAKLKEFEGEGISNLNVEKNYQQNLDIARKAETNKNYLIILTDGNDKYSGENNISLMKLNDYADNIHTPLKIYAIRYGRDLVVSPYYEIDDILHSICVSRYLLDPELKGGFFKAGSNNVMSIFRDVADDMSADYAISFFNSEKTYMGITEYRVEIESYEGISGQKKVTIGSPEKPIIMLSKDKSFLTRLLLGLLVGFIFLLVIFITLQLLIPLLKNKFFAMKYHKKYKPSSKELRKVCSYCGNDIQQGDSVVERCQHILHKDCWKENHYQCPEYGQNCKIGKENHFNIEDPFSKANKQYYLSWVLYGLLGGWFAWMLYILLFQFAPDSFVGVSQWLTKTFYVGFSSETEVIQKQLISVLQNKISGLLSIGILLGFLLSFLFGLIDDYREKDWKVFFISFIRACAGSLFGFLAFFVGSIIMLLMSPSQDTTYWWLYSIPSYLLFGMSIGACLSFKSTISFKDGLLGGAVSIIIGFIVLYATTTILKEYATMLTFMIYGAGLGFSIATVRSYSERYFLRVKSEETKEKKIAIHKWMNASGGSCEVYIGKANDCEIQMNWDKSNNVGKRHAKLYYDKNKNMAFLHVLEPGVTYNERIECEKDGKYRLMNNHVFKIGNTVFHYFEED